MAVLGYSDWQKRLLAGIKAPVTPTNVDFINAWQRAEGGGASNNPFNTTLPRPGAVPYNTLASGGHVWKYASPEQGLDATLSTLNEGRYRDIVNALRKSNQGAAVNALSASPWGTSASLVSKILGGGPVSASPLPPGGATLSTPISSSMPPPSNQPSVPNIKPLQFAPPPAAPPLLTSSMPLTSALPSPGGVPLIGRGPDALLQQLMKQNAASAALPPARLNSGALSRSLLPPPPPVTGPAGTGATTDTGPPPKPGRALQGVKFGDPIPIKMQTAVSTEHPTMNLPGFPAHDYMSHAGAPVVAPVGGKIVRFSGHDPSEGPPEGIHGPFGWSIYLQGNDGRVYYMTHLGSRDVQVGQRVRAGTPIATVGDYARWGGADHVHMGVSTQAGSWNN